VVGVPVDWTDLAASDEGDRAAVDELTERIETAMRQVTLNLARWEDESVVRTAEAVWSVARNADPSPAARVARLALATDMLAKLRAGGDEQWNVLARDVRTHGRVLSLLGLRAEDVKLDMRLGAAAKWALRRLAAEGIAQAIVAVIAIVTFWIPYRVTGLVAARMTKTRDTISTYRVLVGAVAFLLWNLLLSAMVAVTAGWAAAFAVFVLLPVLGVAGLSCIEQASWTFRTARRWLVLRRGDPRIAALRERQAELANRLDDALAARTQPS
jgi:hypothetical protein